MGVTFSVTECCKHSSHFSHHQDPARTASYRISVGPCANTWDTAVSGLIPRLCRTLAVPSLPRGFMRTVPRPLNLLPARDKLPPPAHGGSGIAGIFLLRRAFWIAADLKAVVLIPSEFLLLINPQNPPVQAFTPAKANVWLGGWGARTRARIGRRGLRRIGIPSNAPIPVGVCRKAFCSPDRQCGVRKNSFHIVDLADLAQNVSCGCGMGRATSGAKGPVVDVLPAVKKRNFPF